MAQVMADQPAAVQNAQDFATQQVASNEPMVHSSRQKELPPEEQIKQSQLRQKEQRTSFFFL